MLSFKIDQQKCIKCGECVTDCPAKVISTTDGCPHIAPDKEASCYQCQHCFAVCPTGALSILGLLPEQSRFIEGTLPSPEQMEALMRGRRSVRRYQKENLPSDTMEHLLNVAWSAPTGVNARQVRFTVIDDREKLAKLRDGVMAGLAGLVREKALPEAYARFGSFVPAWEEQGIDIIFRDAPHLVIASAPQSAPTPLADCIIALSYFELFAQASGVGTLWCGLAKYAVDDILPATRKTLGIPDDHLVGYVMLFGKPAVHYPRAAQRGPALVHRV